MVTSAGIDAFELGCTGRWDGTPGCEPADLEEWDEAVAVGGVVEWVAAGVW